MTPCNLHYHVRAPLSGKLKTALKCYFKNNKLKDDEDGDDDDSDDDSDSMKATQTQGVSDSDVSDNDVVPDTPLVSSRSQRPVSRSSSSRVPLSKPRQSSTPLDTYTDELGKSDSESEAASDPPSPVQIKSKRRRSSSGALGTKSKLKSTKKSRKIKIMPDTRNLQLAPLESNYSQICFTFWLIDVMLIININDNCVSC